MLGSLGWACCAGFKPDNLQYIQLRKTFDQVCLAVFVLIITEHLGKTQEKYKALIKIFCLFYFKLGNNGYLVESFREQGLPAWLAHPQQVSSKIGELKKGISS